MSLGITITIHQLINSTVLATQAIANVVKTSFGPSGLDKMMVDDIGVCYSYSMHHDGLLIALRTSQ